MASVVRRFVKPPTVKLLKGIPQQDLVKPLSDKQLSVIAHEVLEWQAKAIDLGLSEGEIENIREDHKNSHLLQKITMLRTWRAKNGDRATLRKLIMVSQKHGWSSKFIKSVCKKLNYSQGSYYNEPFYITATSAVSENTLVAKRHSLLEDDVGSCYFPI